MKTLHESQVFEQTADFHVVRDCLSKAFGRDETGKFFERLAEEISRITGRKVEYHYWLDACDFDGVAVFRCRRKKTLSRKRHLTKRPLIPTS